MLDRRAAIRGSAPGWAPWPVGLVQSSDTSTAGAGPNRSCPNTTCCCRFTDEVTRRGREPAACHIKAAHPIPECVDDSAAVRVDQHLLAELYSLQSVSNAHNALSIGPMRVKHFPGQRISYMVAHRRHCAPEALTNSDSAVRTTPRRQLRIYDVESNPVEMITSDDLALHRLPATDVLERIVVGTKGLSRSAPAIASQPGFWPCCPTRCWPNRRCADCIQLLNSSSTAVLTPRPEFKTGFSDSAQSTDDDCARRQAPGANDKTTFPGRTVPCSWRSSEPVTPWHLEELHVPELPGPGLAR